MLSSKDRGYTREELEREFPGNNWSHVEYGENYKLNAVISGVSGINSMNPDGMELHLLSEKGQKVKVKTNRIGVSQNPQTLELNMYNPFKPLRYTTAPILKPTIISDDDLRDIFKKSKRNKKKYTKNKWMKTFNDNFFYLIFNWLPTLVKNICKKIWK